MLGALVFAVWHGSGRWFQDQARQDAANHYDALRTCLLGDGANYGRPSARLHGIRLGLGDRATDWPMRCVPHAAALDAAVEYGTPHHAS